MMMESLPPIHRPLVNDVSTSHRDLVDDRYRELRRARKVFFYCNGDRYFKGKRLHITPHRYLSFNDLLGDLTQKLPKGAQLPYGVRQIYTPVGGTKVKDIEELQDGGEYVCAGFETFKAVPYGKYQLERWVNQDQSNIVNKSDSRVHQHYDHFQDFNNFTGSYPPPRGGYYKGAHGFHPNRHFRNSFPRGRGPLGSQQTRPGRQGDGATQAKPRVITVVRFGERPRTVVKILLNRNSIRSYEQLMSDIAESFGPKWKNKKLKKLYSVKGKPIQSVSDFFREDDVYIAVGDNDPGISDVQDILNEIGSDRDYIKKCLREWQKRHKSKDNNNKGGFVEEDKRDSGFADAESQGEGDGVDDKGNKGGKRSRADQRDGRRTRNTYYDKENRLSARPDESDDPSEQNKVRSRLDNEKRKTAADDRDRARRLMQKRLDAEQRALEDERRKRGLIPLRQYQDPYKRMLEDREKQRNRRKGRGAQGAVTGSESESEVDRPGRGRANKKSSKISLDEIDKVQKSNDDDEVERKERERKEREKQQLKEREEELERQKEKERKEKEALEKERQRQKELKEKEEREIAEKEAKDLEEKETKEVKFDEEITNNEKEEEDKRLKNKIEEERLKQKENDKNRENRKIESNNKVSDSNKTKKPLNTAAQRKLDRQISNVNYVYDRYEIGKTLGDGNFAVVKQARLKNTTNEYAMKIVDKSKLKGKEHMIENEILVLKMCNHPNICKLKEEYETRSEIFLVMELVKGGDLFDAITQSVKFDEKTAASMVRDLTNALFYLHSRSIVHRDMKPENLLVCRNKDNTFTLKLGDFGLAMEVTKPITTVCGTPTYVAPEILSEIGYGLEVDLWALGVITYILLCGFPPFRSPDRNQTELFEFIKAGEYEFLAPYWDNISRSAKDLIENLLVVKKRDRYTAIDVLCHPWIITQANTLQPPDSMANYRVNLRKDLETQAKMNLDNHRKLYHGSGK